MAAYDIQFDGLTAPVRTVDCESTLEGLSEYCPRWPFTVVPMGKAAACATLANNGQAWRIQSPHTPAPRIHKTEVNAVCDLMSILASALIAQAPDLLCFHAAAVETQQGLILFPALRRAGKSTLSAELMARGLRLFTDDYLPVIRDGRRGLIGQATGLAARLRVPLPDSISQQGRAFITANPGPQNKQYRYLAGPQIADYGTSAPIRSIVILDRVDKGDARLALMDQGETLARLAKQNFSRGLPAGETLTAMIGLIKTAPPVQLTYADPGEAAELILSGALPMGDGKEVPQSPFPQPGPIPDPKPLDRRFRYQRTAFATLHEAGEVWVGPSYDGRKMLQFDSAAVGVLDLLSDPLTPRTLVSLIAQAYPDADRAELEMRVEAILVSFLKVGFIERTSA